MGEWQSIEVAPKEQGKWVLLADDKRSCAGYWDARVPGGSMRWISVNGYFGSGWEPRRQPTHWMPFPEPPE